MFEAVLFDLDGTLIDFVETDTRSLQWLHNLLEIKVPFDDFLETAVNEIMKFHALVDDKKIDPMEMHRFRLENTFCKYNLAWNRDYVSLYCQKLLEFSVPFNGVERLLAYLHQKVKTGLITNAYDAREQRERIQHAGLEAYFDVITIAGELGIYKPDPGIFLFALNSLGVSPANALYVGDSIIYDIQSAKAVGMQTVLVSHKESYITAEADYCVCGMDQLQRLLEKIL